MNPSHIASVISSRLFRKEPRRRSAGQRSDDHLYTAYPPREHSFLNIGVGKFFHPRWTNVDLSSDHYASVQRSPFVNFDISKKQPLPFEDASVELIYSSHTIEHVATDAVRHLLRECHRVLKPKGGLRITCPDFCKLSTRPFTLRGP
jgi:SAM-dependent methyltransferase